MPRVAFRSMHDAKSCCWPLKCKPQPPCIRTAAGAALSHSSLDPYLQ